MSQYFPPYKSSERNIKVKLGLSSYATSLNTEVDKLDIDKLTPVPNVWLR